MYLVGHIFLIRVELGISKCFSYVYVCKLN